MRATVAELQGDAREGGAEGSSRQICGRRNTNRQRGRVWAASVRVNAKPGGHQDTPGRVWRRVGKAHVLTQGDLDCESRQGVSRGHSSLTEPGTREGSSTRHRNALEGEGPKEPASQALEGIGLRQRSKKVRRQSDPFQGGRCQERTCQPLWCSHGKAGRDRTSRRPA
jgi:hypothetical protein